VGTEGTREEQHVEPIDLRKGTMYRIRTIIGHQQLQREHVMTFLDYNVDHTELFFNARPFAGTQTLRWKDILKIDVIRHNTQGRDSKLHYMNKIVRPSQKAEQRFSERARR
jgi:hypothetical protein